MPLTLVLGPANSAKAGEVLGAYADAAQRGALLVVPTSADAEHYGRELAAQGAVLGSVMTFPALAGELATRAGYAARRLSPVQRERVLRKVVAATRLRTLGPSAGSSGFATAVGNLISELERSLIAPGRLATALNRWAQTDPRREPYAQDIAALYRAYADELERLGRVDGELFAWRALDALRAAPHLWGGDPVFFYGFDDLTPLERDAIETLSRVVGVEVTVSLTYESGRAAFAARAEAVEELKPLATRVTELPAQDAHYAPQSREALHHLERNLFEPAAPALDPGPAVRLLEAGGERAEAELIAAEVLSQLRNGIPGDEIAVMTRSVERAAPVLERVFAQYGIATACQRPQRFTHTAFGRSLLALARCAWLPDAPAEELIAYMRAPGLLERAEVADHLEFKVRTGAVTAAAQARELLGWSPSEIEALQEASDPAAELAWQARKLFSAPHRGRAPELDSAEELDARALAALIGALQELADLGERATGQELLELLEELEVRGAGLQPSDAVLIADPLGLRARRFQVVFVCGLQEGDFPLPGTPEPFLSDEHRRELALCSGLVLRPREDAVDRERYLFYACISRATEQLFLSYRSSDEEGNLELRSPFLADVEELFGAEWAGRRRKRLLADVVWAPDTAPTARELARSQAAAGAPAAGAPAEPRRLSEVALAQVRHREVVSAGALEMYASCPLRWLVERELAPERFEPEPEAMARGSYIHNALENVLTRLGGPVSAETLPRAQEILTEVLAEAPFPLAPGRPEPVRAAVRTAIEADLRRYLEHEAADGCGWPPEGLELRFGFTDEDEEEEGSNEGAEAAPSLPALTLGEGETQVALRGVIDRVDVEPGGSRRTVVRDYKSGSRRSRYFGANWAEEDQLQVALYMLAVRELCGLEPVAGLYQPLGGDDLRARGMYVKDAPVGTKVVATDGCDAEGLEQAMAAAAERAVALAAKLRTGELEPSPQTCSRWGCQYPGICRSQ